MNLSFVEKVDNAQKNKGVELLNITSDFLPLIKKYTYKLNYEDALYDMQYDFINLILSIDINKFKTKEDKYLLSYIKKSMYTTYIKRSQDQQTYKCSNLLINNDVSDFFENKSAEHDHYDKIFFDDIKDYLTEKEYKVIYRIYYLNMSVNEIAQLENIRRQNVNKMKNNALKKLKEQYYNN